MHETLMQTLSVMNLWKFLMILLIRMLHIGTHLEKNNAPLTNHGSPKAFWLPLQKRIPSTESSWLQTPNIIRKYKTYRNKLSHLKWISKQNYYKQAFQKCHHDIKKTWKLVNEIIAIKNKSQQKISFLMTQNAKNNVKI